MKNIYRILTLLFVSIVTLQCSQMLEDGKGPFKKFIPALPGVSDMNPPMVVGSWPLKDQNLVDPKTEISITFSMDMNKGYTESASSLKLNGSQIDGTFKWLGRTMIFKPLTFLNKPGVYIFTVSKSGAESSSGANMLNDYIIRFNFNPDVSEPALNYTTPVNGTTGVNTGTTVVLKFSKSMDSNSVLGAVSTSPDMKFNLPSTVITENNSKFEFKPLKPLSYGTTYTVSIPNTIKDSSGLTLIQTYTITFVVGDDFTAPTLTGITSTVTSQTNPATVSTNFVGSQFGTSGIIHGFDKKDGLVFTFSEAVTPVSIANGISITPSVTYQLTDTSSGAGTQYTLTPATDLDIAQVYQVQVTTQIKDAQNNPLATSYSYQIKIDGPQSRFLKIDKIYVDNPNANISAGTINPVSLNSLTGDTIVGNTGNYSAGNNGLYIYFCRDYNGTCSPDVSNGNKDININFTSVKMSIAFDFGPDPASPYLTLPANFTPTGYPIDKFAFKTTLTGLTLYPNTYLLTVTGGTSGVKDSYGNYMQNDYTFRIQLNP